MANRANRDDGPIEALVPNRPHRDQHARQQALDSLQIVRDLVLNMDHQFLAKEIKQQVNSLLEDHNARLRVFMVAMSKTKIEELTQLSSDIEVVRDSIMQDFDLQDMSNGQKMELFRRMSEREILLIEFVKQVIEGGHPSRYESPQQAQDTEKALSEEHGVDVPLIQSRRQVLALVERTRAFVENNDKKK